MGGGTAVEFSTLVCRVPKAEGCIVPPPPKKKNHKAPSDQDLP